MEMITKNKVDNFELIESLLDFSEPNTFYLIQILKRRKENPDMKTGVRTINNYYIYNDKDISYLKNRIIEDCETNNARAYINLNRLDTEKIALYTLKTITDYIIGKQFISVKNAYAVACGNYPSDDSKKWLIDIDIVDSNGVRDIKQIELANEIIEMINELHLETKKKNYKIIAQIPTKNGFHIITNPFNKQKLGMRFPEITIYKNSPTVLYI